MRKTLIFIAGIGLAMHLSIVKASVDYERIYHKQCATCHGNKGDGKGRAGASLKPHPTSFVDEKNTDRLTVDRMIIAIRDGVPRTSMVGYGRRFNQEEIRGLANYIHARFVKKTSQASMAGVASNNMEGKIIYDKNCSACHGDNGNTAVWAKNGLNPPPRNFTSAQAKMELTRERMITSITHGRPGTAMMPFSKRLNQKEIEQVVDFIRATFIHPKNHESTSDSHVQHIERNHQRHAPPSLAATASLPEIDMGLAFPHQLVGNAEAGKNFYQSNCFACHGRKGQGNGPRSKFNFPPPRDFTSSESRKEFNRPRLFRAISHGKRGTVMPAWSSVLSNQQIADVAEYVLQQFILANEKKKFSVMKRNLH